MALGSGGGGGGGNAGGVRAGRAYVELGAKDTLSRTLKNVAGRFAAFGKSVISLSGVGGIVGGILGGLSVEKFRETVDDLKRMDDAAKALGVSGKAASGLFGVLKQFGGDFKEDLEGITQFSNSIQEALADTSKTTALFQGLSISAKDLAGVGLDEQFYRIHAALRELPQEQQAFKLGLVGGTDSMKKWLPLLTLSNDELRKQASLSAKSGAELEQASKASKAMAAAGRSIEAAWLRAAVVVAPAAESVANFVAQALQPVSEYLSGRQFSDIMQEVGIRLEGFFIDAKWAGMEFIADVTDFFTSAWDGAIAGVKTMLGDLFTYAADQFRKTFAVPLNALKLVNPQLAGGINAALAGAGVVGGALPNSAAAGLAAGDLNRAAGRLALNAARDREKGLNADLLGNLLGRVQAERDRQAWADLMKTPLANLNGPMQKAASSLGTFSGGSFLGSAYGVQTANTAKEMLKEQKKGNVLLGDVIRAVERSVLRFS